jgi:16S rRNA (guanine966-N2)-methyltransferase
MVHSTGDDVEKSEIRIVAGTLRGRKIVCHVHEGMRPTPQMVREALFSILGNAVPERIFYDIFGGTGVIGLEAISRGASETRFIEADGKLAAEIEKHANRFGVADRVQVLKSDAYRWGERWVPPARSGAVNLFLSPPFPDLSVEKLPAFLRLINTLLEKAPPESVMTIQSEMGFPVEQLPNPGEWDIRSYGRNMLCFYVKPAVVQPAPEAASSN